MITPTSATALGLKLGVNSADVNDAPGATQDLVVAQDERHVAFMRDYLPQPPCSPAGEAFHFRALHVGTLLVATLADDGTVAVRVVGHGVKLESVGFSADSKSLAYVDGYDACSLGGVLKTAAADVTNPRTIESVTINFDERIVGNTLLFLKSGASDFVGDVYAVWLPDGAPILISGASSTYVGVWPSPDGRLAGSFDTTGAVSVLDVSTGTSHQLALGSTAVGYDTVLWSANGGFFALESLSLGTQQIGLAVAAPGDAQVTHFASNGLAPNPVFSPDSSRLAYQALDSTGAPEIVVHPLAGGSDLRLQGLPDPANNSFEVSFSPDSAVVLVLATDNTSGVPSLYTASVNGSGSLQLITSHVSANLGFPAMPPGDGNLAVTLDSGDTAVYAFDGADSTLLPGSLPVYEPNSAQPRLLLDPPRQASASTPVPAFLLASTDGTSMKTILLPTSALPWGPGPQWMGHTVVYGFSPALTGTFPALYATSGEGSSPTLLAASPDTYAWAPIPVPTRLFYARAAADITGPAGLWMVPIP
jgi:Tol biopolymer transport system component